MFCISRVQEWSGIVKCGKRSFGIFMNIQECSRVFRESDFGAILEGPGAPKVFFFFDSWSGFAVFKKAWISRVLEAILFFRFPENSKVLFSQTVATVLLFVWIRGLVECSDFWEFGGPRGIFSQTVAAVLVFSRALELIGTQREADPLKSSESSKASSKVLDLLDNSSVALIPRLCNLESPGVL